MQVQKECGLSNGCSMYLLLILVVLQLRGCLGVSGVSLGVSTYGDQVYAGEGMHHAHYASTTQITHEHADMQTPRRHHADTTQTPRRHHADTTQTPRRHHAGTTQTPRRHHAGTTQALHVHIHPIITSNPIPSLITP